MDVVTDYGYGQLDSNRRPFAWLLHQRLDEVDALVQQCFKPLR